jgi:DNA-binding transcriptional ArsR family regulator
MSEQTPPADGSAGTDGGPVDGEGGPAAPAVDGDARVVGLESTDAEAVLGAVSSDTARTVLDALHEEPTTASGLADRVDLSLQTVQYHLANLEEADLVEVVEETTSEKGRSMDVYGPTNQPVVVFAGGEDDADDVRSMLSRLVSAVAFLGLVSLLVQQVVGGDERTGEAVEMTADSARSAGDAAGAAGGVEPGLLFFAGGLVVLAAYGCWWYLRRAGHLDGVLPTA